MKAACTVWVGGKSGDNIKRLPIDIKVVFEGNSVSIDKDPMYAVDHTYGFTVDIRMGVDVVIGSKIGAIELA